MPDSSSIGKRIEAEFANARKEYIANDRTLDAIAALSVVLEAEEIKKETTLVDFRPRLQPDPQDTVPYTPDGHIAQHPTFDFILELKTSWNEKDPQQIVKYGRSQRYLLGEVAQPFGKHRCILLGYQNLPGEENLEALFGAWKAADLSFPLVVFRYSLESGTDGDRLFFFRNSFTHNGVCPASALGKLFNSVRGFFVSVAKYKSARTKIHKVNDEVIASYAAVLWWTVYARYYLTEDQKGEMAERGILNSPLLIPVSEIDRVPIPAGVDIPLGARDVRRALEFLQQAKLVKLKSRSNVFEVVLKEDRYIRLPQMGPSLPEGAQMETSMRILARWATNKITKPIVRPKSKPSAKKKRQKSAPSSVLLPNQRTALAAVGGNVRT